MDRVIFRSEVFSFYPIIRTWVNQSNEKKFQNNPGHIIYNKCQKKFGGCTWQKIVTEGNALLSIFRFGHPSESNYCQLTWPLNF